MISDEATARAHLGFEMPAPSVPVSALATLAEHIDTVVVAVEKRFDDLSEQLKPKVGPLFSEAAKSLIKKVSKARGNKQKSKKHQKEKKEPKEHEEVTALRRLSEVFALVGCNKAVGLYTEDDIQDFVDEIKFLHDDYYREENYRSAKFQRTSKAIKAKV